MKVSVVTAVYNRAETIGSAIQSVLSQQDADVEYIVVDGNSSDATQQVVDRYRSRIQHYIREPDDGIYDALNKGIASATGDVIGFLHADDWLADNGVLQKVAGELADETLHGVYGDLQYVDKKNPAIVRRHWHAGEYDVSKMRFGWMPPHPTVYLRRSCYERFGSFNLSMRTAADYELLVRMLVRHKVRMKYLPHVMVRMRSGGASNASIRNRLNANRDDRAAWTMNGLRPPFALRLTKPLRKLGQFIRRK